MTPKTELLRRIQQLGFTVTELGLYLDSQPSSPQAMGMLRTARAEYLAARKEYEDNYGPLDITGVNTERDGWSWIKGPWPWEGED
ncbi:MAG TPA: spore coat protein CotJB [Candidatus Copromorpha excrementigallinarum]|uniref:Spore coat protein CotJB n=1 Tax=Candidatus Allocopromorpha excrementigallinarum TaxID=2840742 RepID=A0A9D1I2C9_9FIRM|nr:spore coat protein CotJB [Candidatus Copromorpha excrementigallinarum]